MKQNRSITIFMEFLRYMCFQTNPSTVCEWCDMATGYTTNICQFMPKWCVGFSKNRRCSNSICFFWGEKMPRTITMDWHGVFCSDLLAILAPVFSRNHRSNTGPFYGVQWNRIWLVVWIIFYFSIIYGNNMECHHPNWRSYFSEG